jgi:Flp pilus assembly protein TadD
VPGAWLAGAIFALHPVHVESVAWISELKNTLSAVCYLGSAISWLRFREDRSRRAYALAFAFFVLALCSKTVTATLPAALLVLAWWKGRPLSFRSDVLPLLPFFALAGCAAIFSIAVERKLVGAEGAAFELSFVERILIAGRAVWFYLGKLLWPARLTFIYPRWRIDPAVPWQYLYPAAAVAALGALWMARGRLRGPIVAALFFVGTLFPALGFFDVYPFLFSFVADHFQYLASLGVIALAASGIAGAVARAPRGRRAAAYGVCGIVLAALALRTWSQSRLYSDKETLYRATIEANPDCWMAYNNLAGALIERGAMAEAGPLAERALQLAPASAEAHNNQALVLRSRGRLDEAISELERAIAIDPTDPGVHYNVATALIARGRADRAAAHLRRALELDPSLPAAHNVLGMLQAKSGGLEEALGHFRAAVELDPAYADAHNNLGIVLAREGNLTLAIAHFRRALELDPTSAEVRKNLELALAKSTRTR